MKALGLVAAALLAMLPVTARAAWRQAESNHFVIYTEGDEASARSAAVKLEKYLHMLKVVSGARGEDSPVKIRIYMVDSMQAVSAALPFGGGSGIAGFYNANLRGPFAVSARNLFRSNYQRGDLDTRSAMDGNHVLLHELTHHFMYQYFPAAYPTWYSEGFADFYGSAAIGDDDVIQVGAPVENRYLSFQGNNWLPLRRMLNARSYADVSGSVLELYAQGWLLVHYLSTTKARPGQLAAYLRAINSGKSFADAAAGAFGDVDKLDAELRDYAGRRRVQTMVLPFKKIDTGPVTVRDLTAAETAMLPFQRTLSVGIPASESASFADRATAAASRFPDDPHVLSILVDAQRLAGRSDAAAETAARWSKAASGDALALATGAMIRMDALSAAKSTDAAAWNAVRSTLIAAMKRAPDQPRILEAYYRSFAMGGAAPPTGAQNALFRAYQILPQDDDLRQDVAADFEARGMIDEAIIVIKPIAVVISEKEETAEAKAKREIRRAKYRIAGTPVKARESAREMLLRLERKKGAPAA